MAADPGTILGWGRIDPYLVWAERTDYAGMPLRDGVRVPLLIEFPSERHQRELIEQIERHADPSFAGRVSFIRTRERAQTAHVDKDVVVALLAAVTALGLRWELGLPFASPNALPFLLRQPRRPQVPGGRRVVGFIDHGCAFAHRQFRAWSGGAPGIGTRVFALWDQAADAAGARQRAAAAGLQPPRWIEPGDFGYGAEWWREPLVPAPGDDDAALHRGLLMDAYVAQFLRGGFVDETACYAHSGYRAVQAPVTHGTHMMDVATGRPDPLLAPDAVEADPADADIVFVQLPRHFDGRQVSGLLRTYVLDAVRYITSCADKATPVTINLSYGAYAGSHDGTSILDLALDEAIQNRRDAGGQTDIVIAAGNGADTGTHAQLDIPPGGVAALVWHNVADNPTDQFVEFWFDASSDCKLRVTPPGTDPEAVDWVVRGRSHDVVHGGSPVALLTFPTDVCQSLRRRMALLAVAPTANGNGQRKAAPYGRWTVEVANNAAAVARVRAWIERDDPVFQSGSGPRQARFEGVGVSPEDTLNSLAHGDLTITVGGFVAGSGRQPSYSGRGPETGPTAPPPKTRPEWLAVCEESPALPGIAAAAVIGTERVRLPGTSVAAAAATRHVVNARRIDPTNIGALQPPPVGGDEEGNDCMPRVPCPLPKRRGL